MANTENWRVNSRTGISYPKTITDEAHTIGYDEAIADYCIRLNEAPYKATPSSVSIRESGTGVVEFTEVSTAPSTDQYYVDYDAAGRFGTGVVLFNAADNGRAVLVTYQGLGRTTNYDILMDSDSFSIGGDLDIGGDLNLALSSTINLNSVPLLGHIASQTNSADVLTTTALRLWTGSGVISGGSTTQSIAHGISNLVSAQKLIIANGHMYNSSTEATATTATTQYTASSSTIPLRFTIDDTNISVIRGATVGDYGFRCWIVYI